VALVVRDASATMSGTNPSEGLASPEVASMLEDRIAVANSGAGEALAAFYTGPRSSKSGTRNPPW
jgi:hypothetical protein